MFQINRNYCCKTEEQLLYNIMLLLTELNAKLDKRSQASPPAGAAVKQKAGRADRADTEAANKPSNIY